jgi:hypothetical protein
MKIAENDIIKNEWVLKEEEFKNIANTKKKYDSKIPFFIVIYF